jgi:hypothetical protein
MPGNVTLHPPRDEQVFEDLCLDLFSAQWNGAQLSSMFSAWDAPPWAWPWARVAI